MKKILKYLSVIIVVIAVSVAVYSISSSNDSVQMQNKEALAEKDPIVDIPCSIEDETCSFFGRTTGGVLVLIQMNGMIKSSH